MKTHPRFVRIVCGLMLCLAGDSALANGDLRQLSVHGMARRAPAQTLGAMLPERAHVLIFVDLGSAQSLSFLQVLRRDGYPGYRTTIVLLSRNELAGAGAIDLRQWPDAQIVRADRDAARAALGLQSFPAVVAVDDTQAVVWQRSAPSQRRSLALVAKMLEWLQ
ncbi:hypothetical protein C7S18_02600 [Ahniella affigens]|uniref:Thioredoxin domain-containing protein n=1 Tax=Ahniella affigens TaxID=2021234 RepID=A0A2P1PMU0_9GAMM|nr:hypothetical protein [Ahniella affigens]AVP96149.1 hypothetical protein C7S18_02600 [Ahniella affigens]